MKGLERQTRYIITGNALAVGTPTKPEASELADREVCPTKKLSASPTFDHTPARLKPDFSSRQLASSKQARQRLVSDSHSGSERGVGNPLRGVGAGFSAHPVPRTASPPSKMRMAGVWLKTTDNPPDPERAVDGQRNREMLRRTRRFVRDAGCVRSYRV